MAKATRQMRQNEEHYVAKMNFRSEKILQSQIERLNREKLLQVKSVNAQMRTYERKLQKINERAAEVEKLSQNIDPSQCLSTRDHFNKLSNDAVRQRHFSTGVGYSYIDQLLGASKPLVNRPIRWGINPSLPSLEQQTAKPITVESDAVLAKAFMTEIKGHPIYLRPREAAYMKKQKSVPSALILPPLPLKPCGKKTMEQQSIEQRRKPRDYELQEKAENIASLDNQDANSQLSPILENEIEADISEMKRCDSKLAPDENEPIDHISSTEGMTKAKGSLAMEKPEIVIESNEALSLDKEIASDVSSSSSLRGHFITEYEFPSHQRADHFTRSTETLNVQTGEITKPHNENEPSSFQYQLHSRRFSL